jgi:type IV pilus assembly protein PilP
MMVKSKIIFLVVTFCFVVLTFACKDQSQTIRKKSTSHVVSGKISRPLIQNKLPKDNKPKDGKKDELRPINNPISVAQPKLENNSQVSEQNTLNQKAEHYNSQGKIDPFRPLIQEKPEEKGPIVDDKPKRILTPLEKIELSQIRLVAVVIMKDKQIAMVEEASGKGYEVGIGTYIGKNQGRVSEIKNSSIVIKELVRDYKGRLKEHVQEIKLHKSDNEE